MATRKLKYRITGLNALLMHNSQLADPMNPFTRAIKALTSKRVKTDADLEQIARLEWEGSLYVNEDKRPCLPWTVIEGVIKAAAAKQKLKKVAQAAIWCDKNAAITLPETLSLDEMREKPEYRHVCPVGVNGNKVIRCRPKFDKWAADVEVEFNDSLINESQIDRIMQDAGESCGVGDYRPRYGRFLAERLN